MGISETDNYKRIKDNGEKNKQQDPKMENGKRVTKGNVTQVVYVVFYLNNIPII